MDLRRWGLPYEPTAADMVRAGVDVVTFSGDKLLGGPQAGFIAGRAELISHINRNALKRALRVDKVRIAALAALLRLYADPDRLPERLPVLRHMTRSASDIEAQARRLAPPVAQTLAGHASVAVERCDSQAGSGSLPGEGMASFAIAVRPMDPGRKARGSASRVERLSRAFRSLPVPVVGRIHEGVLYLDLRCLEEDAAFVQQLGALLPLLEQQG
jgi:L-seryl-tRNA(Ser) seleniumtransferase